MSYFIVPTSTEKAIYQFDTNFTSTSGAAQQIPLQSVTDAVQTIDSVAIVGNNLVITGEGSFIVTNRLFTRDNVTSGGSADISIVVRDSNASGTILENSRYFVGRPNATQFCRIAHEFTMLFKLGSGESKTLYYSTVSSIGQVVIFGDATDQYSTIEIMKIA